MSNSVARLRLWQGITLALLVSGYAGYYLCRSNLSVVTPLLITHFSASGTPADDAKVSLGWMLSAGALAYAIGKFIGGLSGDFLGGRTNFLVGMGGAILFTALFACGGGLPLLSCFWIGNRFVQSFGWPGMVKVVGRWFDHATYGIAAAVLSLSFLFGDAAARRFIGFLLEKGLGWQEVFFVCAGVLASLFVVTFFALRESPRDVGLSEGTASPQNLYGQEGTDVAGEPSDLLDLLVPLLASPAFWCVCLLSLAMTLLRETFNNWSSTYFQEVVQLPAHEAAKQSAWFPLVGGISVLLAGFLSDYLGRLGRALVIFFGMLLTGGSLWALGQLSADADSIWPIGLVTLTGFLLIGPYAYLAGALSLDFGGKRGAALACGIIDGVGYLASVLGGAGFATAVRDHGWSVSFRILAGVAWASCLVAAVFLMLQMQWRRPSQLPDSSAAER